jgi:hypothetical protein
MNPRRSLKFHFPCQRGLPLTFNQDRILKLWKHAWLPAPVPTEVGMPLPVFHPLVIKKLGGTRNRKLGIENSTVGAL